MSQPNHASPLRYPGGKSRLKEFLVRVLLANELRKPRYVEPYAGGAGAALHLLFDERVDRITINDADPRIYSFWYAVTNHNDRFLERLNTVRASIAEWRRQRQIYDDCDRRRKFELGFAAFYLNRTSRSGIVRNGGPIGGFEQAGDYQIGVRFNRAQLCERIARIGRYGSRIAASHLDGLELLKKLNQNKSEAQDTFVFIDPPYYNKGADLYLNSFGHYQHNELAGFLNVPTKFKWVMTYDNTKEIRALYPELDQLPFYLSYSAYDRRAGQELLIHPETVIVPPAATRALRQVA